MWCAPRWLTTKLTQADGLMPITALVQKAAKAPVLLRPCPCELSPQIAEFGADSRVKSRQNNVPLRSAPIRAISIQLQLLSPPNDSCARIQSSRNNSPIHVLCHRPSRNSW
jgi:hypothetical protein